MRSGSRALFALVVIAVLTRIAFGLFYAEPASYGDTAGYKRLAAMFAAQDLSENDGFRTPLYPLLLWLCASDRVVFVVQLLLGTASSVLLFLAFRLLSGSVAVGFLAGLAHSWNMSQLLHEGALLTETLSVFLFLSATVVLFRLMHQGPGAIRWPPVLLLGLIAGLAVLTRPSSIILPAAIVPFVVLWDRATGRATGRRRLRFSIAYIVPLVLLVSGWMWINARTTGYFAISTLTGANLTHWSGDFMESAPQESAVLRDIYIAHRQRVGTSRQTIWKALPEMRQTTGLSFAEISAEFRSMSVEIIRQHPLAYVRSAVRSTVLFWKPFLNGERHGLSPVLVVACKAVLTFAGLLFLTMPIVIMCVPRLRHSIPMTRELVFVYILVLGSDVLQAVFISVENARYSNVVDPLILGTAIFLCVQVVRAWQGPGRPLRQSAT